MISRYLLLVIFILSSALANSQHSLQITIIELRSNEGVVSIELFDKDENTIKGKTAGISGDSCVMIIEGLKDGKFGPKDFEDWLFELRGETKIKIRTKYF